MYLTRGTRQAATTTTRSLSTNMSKMTLVDSATDYFDNLRWRATEALTSLMSNEERQALLRKMRAVDEISVEKETQKTIAEAVVAAKAEEAQRQQAQWEREKVKLEAQAERAAYERVEADLRIQQQRAAAMEQWKADVAAEVQGEDHPVLGEVVADLGYKRLHVVSAQTLANIPVWKKQRIYRHDRVKTMAADKLKSAHFGLPGVIALHENSEGKLSILDGQHRVGMMTILQEKKEVLSFDLERILVEVFPEATDQDEGYAQDIFTEINKAEPVKLVDMPGVATKTERKVITQGASRLKTKFEEMFKPSQQCRAPHLNVDNLRDALFASDVIKRHNLKSAKALEEWMMSQNDTLREDFSKEENASKVSKTALQKAIKYDFFLGLDSSWLYN